MAFIRNNLAPIGGQASRAVRGTGESVRGAPQIFSYRTQDAAAVVDTAGYFNSARDILIAGDIILRVTIDSAGVPQAVGWHIVMASPVSGNVDVSDTTALSVTNTD